RSEDLRGGADQAHEDEAAFGVAFVDQGRRDAARELGEDAFAVDEHPERALVFARVDRRRVEARRAPAGARARGVGGVGEIEEIGFGSWGVHRRAPARRRAAFKSEAKDAWRGVIAQRGTETCTRLRAR